LKKPHVVVIGAGIGGLVAALELARTGIHVTVLERSGYPGGKLRAVEIDGHPIDSGPTVFTMPWVFEEIFAAAGTTLQDHLCLQPAELLARHAWRDGSRLDLFADIDRSAEAITTFAGPAEAQRYRVFCARAKKTYRALEGPFMRSQRPGMTTLIRASGWRGLLDLWRIRPFESLWRMLGKSFNDPRLRGLFARYATYCGSSPLQAPATLMLIAHVEQSGVWQLDGGMRSLIAAIERLLLDHGGTIQYDTTATDIDIQRGKASGVKLASGERLSADAIIANADVAGIRAGRLGRTVAETFSSATKPQRSLSAVTWSLLAETSGFDLAHHNVFFPDDYPQEFSDIFDHARLPTRPAVYVCAQDRGANKSDPAGAERLFMIANAPAIGDREPFQAETIEPLESAVFQLLQDCGLTIKTRPGCSVVTTPADFEGLFPGSAGALYGSPAHGWKSSFSRPGARSRIPGLYLAGGSVHPGPGVPMVALSGQLAASAVTNDLGQ
jgi:1-hydroxycarotenoid 3,4-desaturase